MKLYLISQDVNNDYDTYDSAVVAAENDEAARLTLPGHSRWGDYYTSWAKNPDQVTVLHIGDAVPGTEAGVICASFNAG